MKTLTITLLVTCAALALLKGIAEMHVAENVHHTHWNAPAWEQTMNAR